MDKAYINIASSSELPIDIGFWVDEDRFHANRGLQMRHLTAMAAGLSAAGYTATVWRETTQREEVKP